ncbi:MULTISPECIES: methyl-accepting chemotaxis protein [unclassified Janthinobacterium]|uniref:methyl-accepting chemotaxis protein n=1 Tax=unclassified Janthinobacterium TaxID=2610881 RepID=UPI001828A1B4|nr:MULTISPECIES: methyl-accepting chemotaxis protein [unclassified Janthinobacterium]MBB5608789.1 methyl-accepting chemotaxis protein [Janthinobacterium sp. S3T4]MBB5613808.1 methyl-accepting chemotaxis protein [Janthinobacterium sp. S3M3]
MKIGTRLSAGLALGLVFMIVISGFAMHNLGKLNEDTDDLATDKVPKVIQAYEIIGGVNEVALAMRNAMLATDAVTLKRELALIEETREAVSARLQTLEKLIADDTDPKSQALYQTVIAARANYQIVQSGFLKISAEQGRREEALAYLLDKVRKQQVIYMHTLIDLVKYQGLAVERANREASESYRDTLIMTLLLTVIAGLAVALFVWRITVSITTPMRNAVRLAQAVADGDLTSKIDCSTRDETGQLLRALMQMNDSLVHTVGQVRSGTETIATASAEIAAGNLDLSSRTEQQAASLEETASSMEQLTSAVQQNAEHARQANQLVVAASDFALKGGQVVSQVVGTMSSIRESSGKIADIIGVIDGIAFQTNILALNAAVEAARAGEQGRGFAVVATEVRNLAQRSATAAREIKELIGRSVDTVEAGGKLVDEAGQTMDGIVGAVGQVAAIMSEIAAASAEQSTGIAQVNQAITQMDAVTQQNAALVEQAAAATQSMREQADLLAQVVRAFKLEQGPAQGRSPAKAAAAVRPGMQRKLLAVG